MKKSQLTAQYIILDTIATIASWMLFNLYLGRFTEYPNLYFSLSFIVELIAISVFWLLLFYVNGFYHNVYRRSRLKELGNSLVVTLVGIIVVVFVAHYNSLFLNRIKVYKALAVLFTFQFSATYFLRLLVTSLVISKIRSLKIFFPTIIVGTGVKAVELFNAMTRNPGVEGNRVIGYVNPVSNSSVERQSFTKCLGSIVNIREIVKNHKVEEVIIAIESIENKDLARVVNGLMGLNVVVKAIPGLYDHLLGRVKVSSIYGIPLMQVSLRAMPLWQEILKLSLDKILSIIVVICLIPIYLILAVVVKLTSKGPLLFKQERVGRYGKPFVLYKFRTMVPNAEANGPALSSKNDERVTSVGRFMRKTRLDELPNFFNVLKGDLSIVGPRPERQFFIDKIVEKAPHYLQLLRVKPGITSWGQVKYGYAENVDQMIERLEFDLLYLENMSLLVDFRIMVYTIITVLRGRGV